MKPGMKLSSLGNLLMDQGLISFEQLKIGLEEQKTNGKRLGTILMELGFLDGFDFARAIGLQNEIEVITIENCFLDPRAVHQVPQNLARTLKGLPVLLLDDTVVIGFYKDRISHLDLNDLETRLKIKVEPIPVKVPEIESVIDRVYEILANRRVRDKRIGQYLVEAKVVTKDQLVQAINKQVATGKRLGTILTEDQVLTEDQFGEVLAQRWGLPFLSRKHLKDNLDPHLALKVAENFKKFNKVLPFGVADDLGLIAVSAPMDPPLRETLKTQLGVSRLEFYMAREDDLQELVSDLHQREEYYRGRSFLDASRFQMVDYSQMERDLIHPPDLERVPPSDAPIARVLNYMLYQAIARHAQEVHIQLEEGHPVVRFKINLRLAGQLQIPIDKNNYRPIVTKLMCEAGLSLTRRDAVQEGVFTRKYLKSNNYLQFSVSVQPEEMGGRVLIKVMNAH